MLCFVRFELVTNKATNWPKYQKKVTFKNEFRFLIGVTNLRQQLSKLTREREIHVDCAHYKYYIQTSRSCRNNVGQNKLVIEKKKYYVRQIIETWSKINFIVKHITVLESNQVDYGFLGVKSVRIDLNKNVIF